MNALVLSPREPEHEASGSLRVRQALAATFRRPFPVEGSVMTLQVLYVAGAVSPWRLIELIRTPTFRQV